MMPGPDFTTDEQLLEFARMAGSTSITRSAPARWATGRGGGRSTSCAYTAVEGLRVVDASIMPRLCSGNTKRPDHHDRRKSRRHDPGKRRRTASGVSFIRE